MPIAITSPTTANIKDWTTFDTSQFSLTVQVSGKTQAQLFVSITVNGSTVASQNVTGSSVTFTFDSTIRTALYNALAAGSGLSGVAIIRAVEHNGDYTPISSAQLTGGTVTLNARNTNYTLSTPTTGNPINLDAADPTNINFTSITRPHANFRTKIRVYVNDVLTITRYDWTTSINFDVKSLGYDDEMIAAMGGVSPRDVRFDLITQFLCTSTYIDLAYTAITSGAKQNRFTVTNGVIKTFYTPSTIAMNDFTIEAGMTIPFTITEDAGTDPDSHNLDLKIAGVSVLTRTGIAGSGTITPTAGEITAMLNAIPNSSTATAVLYCTSIKGGSDIGTNNSGNKVATVSNVYQPTLTSISVSEATTNPDVATIVGKYVQSISKLAVVLNGAAASTGATITAYEIILDGKTFTTASLTTDVLENAGAGKTISVRITDSRGRQYYNATQATYDVLAYAKPTITTFDVQRATDVAGTESPIGTYAKYIINAGVSSLINGTEKNAIKYKLYYKELPSGTEQSYTQVSPGGLTFNNFKVYNTPDFYNYPINKSYSVRVEITDNLGQTTTANDIIPLGKVLFDWGEDNVGVGKVHTGVGTVDLAEDASQVSINADGIIQTARKLKSTVATGTAPLEVASQTLVDNLNAALLGGQPGSFYSDIVSSGSSGDHHWVKFKDGTLWKYGTFTFSGTVSTAWGSLYTNASAQTLTFDTTVPFTTIPDVHFTPKSSPNNYLVWVESYIGTLTNTQWWLISAVSRTVSQTYTIKYSAVGRWN